MLALTYIFTIILTAENCQSIHPRDHGAPASLNRTGPYFVPVPFSGRLTGLIAKEIPKEVNYVNDKLHEHGLFTTAVRRKNPSMIRLRFSALRRFLIFGLLLTLLSGPAAYGFQDIGSYEYNRARLLAYLVRKDLETYHFTHKKIDDKFSEAAFGLYLKDLDGKKRFLLKEDVEKLRTFADHIDDELNSGKLRLPDAGEDMLERRVAVVRHIVDGLLSRNFDFSKNETIETDADKLDYCKTDQELTERWRKLLKYQVLDRYLNLIEDKKSEQENKRKKLPQEDLQKTAREKIQKIYDTFFTQIRQEKERDRFNRYFDAVTRAFDPHTDYMPPTSKEDFDISMRGSLEGIGATLQEEDGYIKVVKIIPGGPAFRQKQLQPADIILKVAQGIGEPVDITGMDIKDAVNLIRGKKGTEVRLTVRNPDGKRLVISIVRDVVELEDTFVKGAVLKQAAGMRLGYIRIPSFYRDFEKAKNGDRGRNATDDVKAELRKLKTMNIDGLILDLRNDGGGALTDAVQIAGLFINTGPVVQIKDSSDRVSVLSDNDRGTSYGGPMVVLVNEFSASASEILAGALQDYGRALIVGGEHTHGKGTVQSVIDLDQTIPFSDMDKYKTLGALKLTIQKFYRITGESTQYRGVLPDIVLPDRLEGLKTGEKYLDYALPWDTVKPTNFTKWPGLHVDLAELRVRSEKRVAADPEFAKITKESRRIEDMQKKTVHSLNFDVAKKEMESMRSLGETEVPNPHGTSKTKKDTSRLTEKQRRELWVKDVGEDPYVREGMAILGDMISLNEKKTAVTAN
jgi:carboxyl-terminal processing protease